MKQRKVSYPGLLEAEERKIIIIVAMAMASCRIPELALAIIYLLWLLTPPDDVVAWGGSATATVLLWTFCFASK
jgi:hypothetical protein